MGLWEGGCGLAPGLVLEDCSGQGQGLVAGGREGSGLMQSPAISGEALPGPLEGEGEFPRRRGDETEEGENREQGSRSGRQPPVGPDTQPSTQPVAQLLTLQPRQSRALFCSGPGASGPSLPSALRSETSAAGPESHLRHSQSFPK